MPHNPEIELADSQIVTALRRVPRRPYIRRNDRGSQDASAGPERRSCSCGGCKRCLENAHWERIFQEKFADPNYYEQDLIGRRRSPYE